MRRACVPGLVHKYLIIVHTIDGFENCLILFIVLKIILLHTCSFNCLIEVICFPLATVCLKMFPVQRILLLSNLNNCLLKQCISWNYSYGDCHCFLNFEQENGVELRYLSAEPVQTESSKVVYLVRSQISLMKFISLNIHNDQSKGLQKEYFVYFVPRRTVVCEKVILLRIFFHIQNAIGTCTNKLFNEFVCV